MPEPNLPLPNALGGMTLAQYQRPNNGGHMTGPKTRGYFGIGVEGVSKSKNVGALLRTAHAFGAAFCFTIGAGFDPRAGRLADTADTPAHVPLWRFGSADELALPQGCVLVGIEMLE